VLAAISAVLLLAGCSSAPAAPPATASTALRPGYPAAFTRATAKSETEHYAHVIEALVPKTDVVSVKSDAELVPGTGSSGPYYAVISTITLDPRANALELAAAMKKKLVGAGWTSHASAVESNQALSALASSKSKRTAWFLELGANDLSSQPPTVTIQLGSPDLPKT
jgi:hypothetical protein